MRRNLLTIAMALVVCGISIAQSLPPNEADSLSRLENSPRHGEWVEYEAAGGDAVDAWVVYPERSDAAPVIIVVHEIYGLTDWIRAVADQFAAEGFIAIAPDFLSGKGPDGGGSYEIGTSGARLLIRDLSSIEIKNRIDGAARYATSLPAATNEYGIVGYCWGGGISFSYATQQPELGAAVAFYGTSPSTDALKSISAPVLGLYGGNDNRVNATIPAAETEMNRLGKTFEKEIFSGAGHGFLRQQSGQSGANRTATEQAWPRAVGFFRMHLENRMTMVPTASIPTLVSYSGDTMAAMVCELELEHVETASADDVALGVAGR